VKSVVETTAYRGTLNYEAMHKPASYSQRAKKVLVYACLKEGNTFRTEARICINTDLVSYVTYIMCTA